MEDKETEKKPIVNPIRNTRDYGMNFLDTITSKLIEESDGTEWHTILSVVTVG